jgi:hypothetical protein
MLSANRGMLFAVLLGGTRIRHVNSNGPQTRLAISALLLIFGLSATFAQLTTLVHCPDVTSQKFLTGQKAHCQLGIPLPLLLGLDSNAKLSVVTVVSDNDYHVRRFLNDLIAIDRGDDEEEIEKEEEEDDEIENYTHRQFPVPTQWAFGPIYDIDAYLVPTSSASTRTSVTSSASNRTSDSESARDDTQFCTESTDYTLYVHMSRDWRHADGDWIIWLANISSTIIHFSRKSAIISGDYLGFFSALDATHYFESLVKGWQPNATPEMFNRTVDWLASSSFRPPLASVPTSSFDVHQHLDSVLDGRALLEFQRSLFWVDDFFCGFGGEGSDPFKREWDSHPEQIRALGHREHVFCVPPSTNNYFQEDGPADKSGLPWQQEVRYPQTIRAIVDALHTHILIHDRSWSVSDWTTSTSNAWLAMQATRFAATDSLYRNACRDSLFSGIASSLAHLFNPP